MVKKRKWSCIIHLRISLPLIISSKKLSLDTAVVSEGLVRSASLVALHIPQRNVAVLLLLLLVLGASTAEGRVNALVGVGSLLDRDLAAAAVALARAAARRQDPEQAGSD